MITTKTTATVITWSPLLRNRVGDTVSHNGFDWSNVTGKNSEPSSVSIDWEQISYAATSSESFEIQVSADGSVFSLPSSVPVTSIDLYVDQVSIFPSDFTLDTDSNTIDFGSEVIFQNSIIHGRLYFN